MKQSISMQKYAYFSNERPIAIDMTMVCIRWKGTQ